MSGCEKCHGKGTVPCSICKGKKTERCERCNGSGKVLCRKCSGNGEIACKACGGSGTQTEWSTCSVCHNGKVTKTRWINCAHCHGTGQIVRRDRLGSCWECDGRGQVKESYEEICPNCHGDYRKSIAQTCSRCHGRGYFSCEVKCGEHHKEIKCDNCDGTGYVTCSHCRGSGSEKCPDCEAREREAKKQREREEREAKERLEREKERREKREREERNRRIEAQEKKEAAEKVAKERRDAIQGCGCVIAVTATIGFFIWWWLEGFTTAALPGMWEQARTFVGGTEGVAKIFCGLVVLFLGWKLITMFKRKKDGSDEPRSQKKRWKFVVLGLLFGFLGLHLAYAKRWFLFLLLWAAFITGGVMSGGKGEPDKPTADAGGTVQAPPPTDSSKKDETVKKEADNPISGIGFAVWGLLWIGGTLFIKKDGKGNRM